MGGGLFFLESEAGFCFVVLRNYILQTPALVTGIFREAQAHSPGGGILFGSVRIRPGYLSRNIKGTMIRGHNEHPEFFLRP